MPEDDDLDDDGHAYALVMPFVVCESEGGPFDDDAFVAGANFARHQFELTAAAGVMVWRDYVDERMVPQYDLLAMDRGFVMTKEPWEEGWMLVTFTRPGTEDQP